LAEETFFEVCLNMLGEFEWQFFAWPVLLSGLHG
jgi:hypothetical protein